MEKETPSKKERELKDEKMGRRGKTVGMGVGKPGRINSFLFLRNLRFAKKWSALIHSRKEAKICEEFANLLEGGFASVEPALSGYDERANYLTSARSPLYGKLMQDSRTKEHISFAPSSKRYFIK